MQTHRQQQQQQRRHLALLLAAAGLVLVSLALTPSVVSAQQQTPAPPPRPTTPRPAPTVATNPGVVTLAPRTRTQTQTIVVPTPAPQRQPIKFLPPLAGEVLVYVGSISSIIAAAVGPYPLMPMQVSRLALLFEIAECGDSGSSAKNKKKKSSSSSSSSSGATTTTITSRPRAATTTTVAAPTTTGSSSSTRNLDSEDSNDAITSSTFGTHFPISAFAGLHLEMGPNKKPTAVDYYRGGIVANVVCGIAVTALLFVAGVVLHCVKPQLAETEDGGIVWKAVTAIMFPSSMIVIHSLLLEGTLFMIVATLIQTNDYAVDLPIAISMLVVMALIFGIGLRGVRRVVFNDRVVKGYSTTVDVQQREQCVGQVVRSSLAAWLFYGRETWHGGRSRTTPTNVYGNREGAKLPPNARRIALFYRHLRPPKGATITVSDLPQLFVGHYFFFEVLVTLLVAVFHAVVPKSCAVGVWGMFACVFIPVLVSVVSRPHLVPLAQWVADAIQILTMLGLLCIGLSTSVFAADDDSAEADASRAALRRISDICGLAGVTIALVSAALSVFASVAFWFAGGKMIPDGGEMRALYMSASNPVSPTGSSSGAAATGGGSGSRRSGGGSSGSREAPLLSNAANSPGRRVIAPNGGGNNNARNRTSMADAGRSRLGIPLTSALEDGGPLSAASIQRQIGDWPPHQARLQHLHHGERLSDTSITIDDSPIRGGNHPHHDHRGGTVASAAVPPVAVVGTMQSVRGGTTTATAAAVGDDRESLVSIRLSNDGSDDDDDGIEIDLSDEDDGGGTAAARGQQRQQVASSSTRYNSIQSAGGVAVASAATTATTTKRRDRAATVGPMHNPLAQQQQAGTTFVSSKDLRSIVRQVQAAKDAADEAAEEAAAAAAAAAASSACSSPSSSPPPLLDPLPPAPAPGSAVRANPFSTATGLRPSSSSSSMTAGSSSSPHSAVAASGRRGGSSSPLNTNQVRSISSGAAGAGTRGSGDHAGAAKNARQHSAHAHRHGTEQDIGGGSGGPAPARSGSAASQRHMNFRFGGVLTPDGSRSNSTASAVAVTAGAVGYTPPLSAQPAAYSQGSSGWQPLERSGSKQPAMNDLQLDRSGSAKLSTVPRHDSSNDFAAVSPTDFLAGSQRAAAGLYAYPHFAGGSADSPPPPPDDDGGGSSAGASPPGPPMSSVTPPPNVFLTGKSGNRASANKTSSNRAAAAASSDVSPSRRTTQQRIADLARSDSVMGDYRPPNDEEEEI